MYDSNSKILLPLINSEQTPITRSHFITSLKYWALSWATYLHPIEIEAVAIPKNSPTIDFIIRKIN